MTSDPPRSESVLVGLAAAGATAVFGLELLSLAGWIGLPGALALGVAAGAAFLASARRPAAPAPPRARIAPAEWAIGAALAILAGVTLILALRAPPNTWDSMTYHLARVAHWVEQGSLRFYPTSIDRQLWEPPLAEYLVTVGYAGLGGRDWAANLPQWIAGAGVALAAAATAGLLGAGRRVRLLAALIAATCPMAILQATSTQTDLLAALWLSILAYLTLAQAVAPRADPWRLAGIGLAFGLALGTKGTALPIALPWLVALVLIERRGLGTRVAARRAGVWISLALLLNIGHWTRTTATFGTPFGPASVHQMLRPASLGPASLASNLVANLSIHAGTPWDGPNRALTRAMIAGNRALGLDPGTLYPYFGGLRVVPWSTHEDRAGSPFHLVLGLLGLGFALAGWRRLDRPRRIAVLALAGSGLLFVTLVRWQPYNGRLHLPLIALAAPLAALLLARWGRRAALAAAALLVAGALPPLLGNATRPIVPALAASDGPRLPGILGQQRAAAYFNARPELAAPYRALAGAIVRTGCPDVGLLAGYDSWEYPLWGLTRRAGTRFRHLGPSPVHATGRPERPCAIVALDTPAGWPGPGEGYGAALVEPGISLWVPAPPPPRPDARPDSKT